MKPLRRWTGAEALPHGLALHFPGGWRLRLLALGPALFRVSLTRGPWRLDRSWCIAPGAPGQVEGRHRDDLAGFALPDWRHGPLDAETLWLATDRLRVEIAAPLRLAWFLDGSPLARDRPTGAYLTRARDAAHEHYMAFDPAEPIHGLGEKTGPLDRRFRRFEMRNLDALGYDAERTDPLYKHIPFTLTATPAGSYGLLYDNLAPLWFDLGQERDNYHAPYRSMRAADGDLDYYLLAAPSALEVVRTQTWLTGGAAFPPRWSLGYSGSTMQYTDLPEPERLIEGFADRAQAEGMAASSFHLSSGYTSIGDKRYVFHWNHDKFPDPAAFAARMAAKGVRLVANIKPCLLRDHPRYAEAEAGGLFIRESGTGAPERSPFWDDEGSHLDFTNPATAAWWRDRVTDELLANGIAATWNDNNEFEVWDDTALAHGFGTPVEIGLIRPVQSLLMLRASAEAQTAHAPGRRPYLVTRSGAPGLQALAQTWTGDNRTDWASLRWNIRTGLGLALSGISNIGHDVGGFAGPKPEPELLLRWIQNGALHPRFTVHSWNADGSVTEPWMYPEIAEAVRTAFALRQRLEPYLYTLLWRYHTRYDPMIRPTFLDHPDDAECWRDTDDFLLGPDLLVASVVEPGQTRRPVHLPENGAGWYDFHTGAHHPAGRTVTLDAPLDRIPLLVRAGAILPLTDGLALWPEAEGASRSELYDDDGDRADWRADHLHLTLTLAARPDRLDLTLESHGTQPTPPLPLIMPPGENRPLFVDGIASTGVLALGG